MNKVWDTDVTYLIFKGSRAYLSTLIAFACSFYKVVVANKVCDKKLWSKIVIAICLILYSNIENKVDENKEVKTEEPNKIEENKEIENKEEKKENVQEINKSEEVNGK